MNGSMSRRVIGHPEKGTHGRAAKSISSSGAQRPVQLCDVPPNTRFLTKCCSMILGCPTDSTSLKRSVTGSVAIPPLSRTSVWISVPMNSLAIVKPAGPLPTMQSSVCSSRPSCRLQRSSTSIRTSLYLRISPRVFARQSAGYFAPDMIGGSRGQTVRTAQSNGLVSRRSVTKSWPIASSWLGCALPVRCG
jgi:hypothetical protein